jgi:hypothetical protein
MKHLIFRQQGEVPSNRGVSQVEAERDRVDRRPRSRRRRKSRPDMGSRFHDAGGLCRRIRFGKTNREIDKQIER